jgi:hypothetical protein
LPPITVLAGRESFCAVGRSVGHCSSSSFAPILRRLSTRAAAQEP